MAGTRMIGSAASRVDGTHVQDVLTDLPLFFVMKMTVVQIVHVPAVFHRGVPAIWTVMVRVIRMRATFLGHENLLRESRIKSLTRTISQSSLIGRRRDITPSAAVFWLVGVRDGIFNELSDVVVGQTVEHVLPLTTAARQALAPQQSQPLGNCGNLLVQHRGEIGNAHLLSPGEQHEDPQAPGVAQRSKDRRGTFQRGFIEIGILQCRPWMVTGGAFRQRHKSSVTCVIEHL